MAPEIHAHQSEDPQKVQTDLSPPFEPASTDAVNIEATPAANLNPPNPSAATKDAPEEVVITGASYTTPEVSRVLTKVIGKDEAVLQEKGKTKLELPNYEIFSVEDLHATCLDRPPGYEPRNGNRPR